MINPAFYVVLGHAAGAVVLSWLYFRRYRMTRPPIGVFNLRDVAFMLGSIILIPYLYLALPLWLVLVLVVIGVLSALYFLGEPVLPTGWLLWLTVLVLTGADIAAMLLLGATSTVFFALNNLVLILSVVSVTNLWAQSGMKARDATVLGVALVIYDFIATAQLTLMTDLVQRLAVLPFSPLIAWPLGQEGHWLGLGMGDVLLAAVFPLVLRKAFGRRAGLVAMAIALLAIALVLLPFGAADEAFPVMIVLGPLMVLQYLYWRRRRGQERTTWQYLQAEPLHSAATAGRPR